MNKTINRLARLIAAVVLTLNLTGIAPFLTQPVNAAPLCTIDSSGPNDQPGQKDLTKMCVDYANSPTTITVTFNFDELGSSGGNTLDGCSLFDTNGDGNINYAVCVTTVGNPATLGVVTTYSCGDTKVDRCTTPTPISNGTTSCTVTQPATGDPFPAGADYPKDTQVSCVIQLSTVGGTSATLVDVCSYPSTQPNSDPSDCVIARARAGKLEVIKNLVPVNDSGLFNLQIDSITKVSNVSNGGTTGEFVVSEGNHSVGELAGTNTSLSGYSSGIVCRNLNGTGAIVAQSTTTSIAAVPVADGSDVVCTITNTRQSGSVRVVKDIINDNGGTKTSADYTFTNNAGSAQSFVTTTSPDGERVLSLPVGSSFSIVEVQANTGGYATSYTGTCSGTVTVAEQVCTITNNDQQGSLTINKTVVNDNGGNAQASDFSFKKTGDAANYNFINGATTLVGSKTFTINAGTYSAVENTFPGYTMTGNTCTNVVVANGGTASCTITNDDNAATLTVIKNVINDNGGTATVTDFGITNNNSGLSFGTGVVIGNTTTYTSTPTVLSNTNYTLSEIDLAGYAEGIWTCNDGTTGTGRSVLVNLDESDNVTCTVTNEDVTPVLTILKQVLNPYGTALPASSFPLFVDNTSVTSGVATSQFNAGTHTVTETQQTGYTFASFTGTNCSYTDGIMSVLLSLAGNTTCTITNTAIQPKLTVTKVVTNDNGGSKVISDFPLFVNQTSVTSGVQNGFNTGSYTISETSDPGYESSITGDCSGNGEITLNLGDVKSCIITNNDIAPKLKLVKTVINDNGGTKVVSDFALAINGNTVVSGQPNTLSANVLYTASETNLPGYAASAWGGDCAANGTITLAPGDTKTCTITNDDVAAKLTLVKTVTNDNGGTNVATDFQAKVDGNNVAWSTQVSLSAGQHLASEVSLPTYTASVWGGDCATNGTITLLPSDVKSCSITNDDKAPSLTLNKILVDSFGGSYTEASWLLTADGAVTDLSGNGAAGSTDVVSGSGFYAGSYTLSESGPTTGVTSGSWNCGDTVVTSNVIAIALGQVVTCTITNTTVQPKITLVKAIDGNQYGDSATVNNFGLTIGGSPATSGTAYGKNVGSYALNEAGKDGYSFVSITGDAKCPATLGGTVSLALGDDITCTITNTAIQPKLTVTKVVTNDNGGSKVISDFPLFVNQTSVTSGVQNGFNTGSYTVSETNQTGYVGTISGDCSTNGSISLSLGDVKTCTITNDDIAPKLTLYKEVVNDNSGESESSDWTLSATPTYDDEEQTGNTLSGNGENGFISKEVSSHVTYTLSENGPDGYTAGDWDCYSEGRGVFSNPEGYNNQIRMSEGADVTCTITNNDNPNPALNVVKTGPKSSVAGSTVTYTFTVTNTGDVALNGLTVVDSITGDGTYVSGDTNDDDMLDLTETWVYSAKYTIPANQVAPVVNIITVCAYEQRVKVCDTDKHTLTIPQVLGTSTTKLVDTGSSLLNAYTAVALINISALLTLVAFNKKQNARTTK